MLGGFQHRIGVIARTHNPGDHVVEIFRCGISQQRWIEAQPTEHQFLLGIHRHSHHLRVLAARFSAGLSARAIELLIGIHLIHRLGGSASTTAAAAASASIAIAGARHLSSR